MFGGVYTLFNQALNMIAFVAFIRLSEMIWPWPNSAAQVLQKAMIKKIIT